MTVDPQPAGRIIAVPVRLAAMEAFFRIIERINDAGDHFPTYRVAALWGC